MREKVCRQLEILKKNQERMEALKQNLIEDSDKKIEFLNKNGYKFESEHIAIIHSYEVRVINADNKMITLARIGRIIWINQVIKRTTNTTANNL